MGGSEGRDEQFHIVVGEVLLEGSLDLSIGGSVLIGTHVAADVGPHAHSIHCAARIGPKGQSDIIVRQRSLGEAWDGKRSRHGQISPP